MQAPSRSEIKTQLRQTAAHVNAALAQRLAALQGVPPRLLAAMRYSLEAGGKRLRPGLVLWACELCGGSDEIAMPAAMAVECVHTFSLIHDDLPAIDNDDLRRGMPTSHKQFGEALAILAGDALLTLAFEILSQEVLAAEMSKAMTEELARAAGAGGLIGGEAADIEGEKASPNLDLVRRIHAAKTARLIEASCRLGAIAGQADATRLAALAEYGHWLGMAFQASDDLLDVMGSTEIMGKAVQKDTTAGKQTYPRAVGIEEARRIALQAADAAEQALAIFGERAGRLADLARYVVERDS